jgi:transcriptional regulator with XRE-family HTH domain
MVARTNRKPRDKGLDLYRRAKALGVTPGHLSRVLSGKRESANLLVRLGKLIKSERTSNQGTK